MARGLLGVLWPTQRQILTREGFIYFCVGIALLGAGLLHQINLILLVFALSAGPFLASIFGGRAMLRRLSVGGELPSYVFAGEPLVIDYTVENSRRWFAVLALFLEDMLIPVDRSIPAATNISPRIFFARVAGRDRARCAGSQRVRSAATIACTKSISEHAHPSGLLSTASRFSIPIKCLSILALAIFPSMVSDSAPGDREPTGPAS